MFNNIDDFTSTIRDGLLEEFKNLENQKKEGKLTTDDLEYYLARDRKAMVILKTLQLEIQNQYRIIKHGIPKK